MNHLPGESDFPRVRDHGAAERLDQRRLAGAVVAEQPEYLALLQVQADVAQCGHRAEALRDVLDAQYIVGVRHRRDDDLSG